MAGKPFFRRTQVVVEKSFQFRFARFVVLFAVVTALITGLTVFFTTFSLLGAKLADVYPQGRLLPIFRSVYFALGLNLLILAPVLFYFSVLFSHRIVGPLPKIYDVLKKVGRGDFSQRVEIRRSDELQGLAETINHMIDLLKKQSETEV